MMREVSEKVEYAIREHLETNGYLKDIDICTKLPKMELDASASTIFQKVRSFFTYSFFQHEDAGILQPSIDQHPLLPTTPACSIFRSM